MRWMFLGSESCVFKLKQCFAIGRSGLSAVLARITASTGPWTTWHPYGWEVLSVYKAAKLNP